MAKGLPPHGRRDSNEGEIVRHLRAVGVQIVKFNIPGFVDYLANYGGKSYFIEDKTRKGKLTRKQTEVFEAWQGQPIYIIRSVEEALALIGAEVTA